MSLKCPKCGNSTNFSIERTPNGKTYCEEEKCKFSGHHILFSTKTQENKKNEKNFYIKDEYDENKFIDANNKIIIAQGGDGTMLKAINNFRHLGKPFYGIGTGTVNFLMNDKSHTDISENAKYKKFNLIKIKVTYTKNYTPDANDFFEGKDDFRKETVTKEYQAFNEIFISEENGWIDFNCHDKDYILGKFKGSGLIISTPQGSTGINKNNNGVILPLSSKDWSITGDKTNRKVNYILKQKPLSVSVKSRGKVNLFIDGNSTKIENITKVEISKGDSVTLIFDDYKNFKRKRII